MYATGRFLGGYQHDTDGGIYIDTNDGDVTSFSGYEWIDLNHVKVYELRYHGGLIRA